MAILLTNHSILNLIIISCSYWQQIFFSLDSETYTTIIYIVYTHIRVCSDNLCLMIAKLPYHQVGSTLVWPHPQQPNAV